MNHPVAVPPMAMRHVHNALAQHLVAILPPPVPEQARAHASHTQGVALRQPPRLTKPYQLAPRRYGHHFFRSASCATSFSRTDSASNFFSRAFSVSSSFNRLASDTDIPPNLDFHR